MSLEKWSERLSDLLDEIEEAGHDPINMVMNVARTYIEQEADSGEEEGANAVIWTFDDGIDLVMALTPADECSGALNASLH